MSGALNADPLILIKGLDFGYVSTAGEAHQWRMRANNLQIERRAFYSVLGPNMSGKSTFLRLIEGSALMESDSSSVFQVAGPLVRLDGRRSRISLDNRIPLSCMMRHDDPMFPELNLWDNVRLARPAFVTIPNKAALQSLRDFLYKTSTLRAAGVSPSTKLGALSSGGRALVRLARATIWGSLLNLVDEVTAHLDDSNAAVFITGLLDSVRNGGAAMMVSHQMRDHELASKLVSNANLQYRRIELTVEEDVTWARVA